MSTTNQSINMMEVITPTGNLSQELMLFQGSLGYRLYKTATSVFRRPRFYLSNKHREIIIKEDLCTGKNLRSYTEILIEGEIEFHRMRSILIHNGMQRMETHEICSPFADVFIHNGNEYHLINIEEIEDSIHEYYYPEGNNSNRPKLPDLMNTLYWQRKGTYSLYAIDDRNIAN